MTRRKKRKFKKWFKIFLASSAACSFGLICTDVYAAYNPYRNIESISSKDSSTITYDVYTKKFMSNGETVKSATLSTNRGTVCTDTKGYAVAETNNNGELEYINKEELLNDGTTNIEIKTGIVDGWLNNIYYVDGKPLGTDEDLLFFIEGETGFYYLQSSLGGKCILNSSIVLNDGRTVRFDEYGHIVSQKVNANNEYYFPISEASEIAEETYTIPADEYSRDSNDDSNITIVNHRGYHEDTTENTLSAFEESKKNNYSYIEADVQMTADDIPVLIHDQSLYRLAGEAVNINDVSLKEAKEYSLEGEEITEFEELISYCKANELSPYIELKAETVTNKNQVQTIYNIVDKYGMVGNVTWISFAPKLLGYVSEIDTEDRIGYLVSTYADSAVEFCQELSDEGINAFVDASYYCYEDYLSGCKKHWIPLEVWTVNSETIIKNLDDYVSGVTTDICSPE